MSVYYTLEPQHVPLSTVLQVLVDHHVITLPTPSSSHTNQTAALNQSASLYLDVHSDANGAYLGCKGWRGTLSTGRIVFAKLWDGWKFSPRHAEHEAAVYNCLRDLWGSIVPEFLGLGIWGFCHILLLSYIEVSSHHPSPSSPFPSSHLYPSSLPFLSFACFFFVPHRIRDINI